MSKSGWRNVNSRMKKSCGAFLALMIIGSIMLGCLIAADIYSSPTAVSANPHINGNTSGPSLLDPTATLNGFHLYNATKLNIPFGGADFDLSYPINWNPTALGLDFFNGTLMQDTATGNLTLNNLGYRGNITGLKVSGNSTICQAQFNITGIKVGETSNWTTANGLSNSSYPTVDGNIGIAQQFLISNHARNLTIQVMLMRIEGTTRNLTVEVRSSTSDNRVGGLIKTVSYASAKIGTGSAWTTLTVPAVDLDPGHYFIVLRTDGWLGSGGGYLAETTLSKRANSSLTGWVSFNRGVNWGNLVNLTSTSSYYFHGFKLRVQVTPMLTPSDLNLRINDFQVADNFMWNQSAGRSGTPSHSFKITSDYPILVLNLTYKAWVYAYGGTLLNKSYRIQINGYKNTTAISRNRNFTVMYVNLNQADLLEPGVINPSTSTIKLNLRLFLDNTAVGGVLNVTAWVQLTTAIQGIQPTGPYSLEFPFNYTHPDNVYMGGTIGGLYNNVTLAETALTLGPISNQIDNVYINGTRIGRSHWSYNLNASWLYIYREAFTILPQFTLFNGSLFNCTVITFNNFTARSSVNMLTPSGMEPVATVEVTNSTPLIDLESLSQVNITVTSPSGTLINNTAFPWTGTNYTFGCTLTGCGVYGIRVISFDSFGYVATRWIGAVTVDDFVLAPPKVILTGLDGQVLTGNLTSGQSILVLANVSYVNHAEFTFNGRVNVTIYLGDLGEADHLAAAWNATTESYSAAYSLPDVDSPIPLTVFVEAVDLEGRISANSTFAYLVPHAAPPIPQVEPSLIGILLLLSTALVLLIPVVAYIVEKRRKA